MLTCDYQQLVYTKIINTSDSAISDSICIIETYINSIIFNFSNS